MDKKNIIIKYCGGKGVISERMFNSISAAMEEYADKKKYIVDFINWVVNQNLMISEDINGYSFRSTTIGGKKYSTEELYNKFVSDSENNEIDNSETSRYTKKLELCEDDEIYTVQEWEEAVAEGCFCNFDGYGYWVREGFRSNDEVFLTPKLDATHVIWFNK